MKQINLRPYQDQFIFGDEYKYKFLKAGWATGKSMCLILACVRQCEMYPDNLGVIYRKEAVDLRDSTIKQFESLIGRKVDSTRQVKFSNGSTLLFRHKEDIFGTVQNMNLGFAGIEEHAEIETDELFYLLFGRLRRDNSGMKLLSVGNACGHNWVYKIKQSGLWDPKDKTKRLDLHLSATTYDNAENLPAEFISSLDVLKVQKPKFFNRFVMNSDDAEDTQDIIIQPEWVRAACERDLSTTPPFRKIASLDVARYGDDKNVIYGLENFKPLGKESWEKKSTMETVGRAVLFMKKHGIEAIAVDEIGVGGGVADRLEELGLQVIFVNASEKAAGSGYYNRRAEIYANGANLLQDGLVEIDPADTALCEQLSWAKYKAIKSNGVFQVEPKDDIKARYGMSPDEADAWLNGVWALPQVRNVPKKDGYARAFDRLRKPVASGMGI